MLVATLPTIEGRPVQWYLGVVSGDASIAGAGLCEARGDLPGAREAAMHAMLNEAAERGANAVVGVIFAYEAIQTRDEGVALMVTASGTAVRI